MATPELPSDAPRVADGRYVLLTRLGEGGMAVVYGAWDQDLHIWRAVKVLLPEYARRGSIRRRFEREGRTMMSLRHPNLVRVHEVRSERALPYLVMDLLPGGSLEDWAVRHGPMPARLATDAALGVCQGLAAVHAAGVIHRDIKPQNILVDADDTAKLTDFGVAHVEGGETRTNVSMGTIGYMSPEQVADSRSVDVRSDLYSVGASLYVLITGRPVRDLFRVSDDPTLLGPLPAGLRPVLARCLAYEREERYDTAEDLLDALIEARRSLPPLPPDTPPLARRRGEAPPGGSPGEFTELDGLLETDRPPDRKRRSSTPTPIPALVQLEATQIALTPPTPLPRAIPERPAPERPSAERVPERTAALAATGTLVGVLALALLGIVLLAVLVPALAASGRARLEGAARAAAAAERIVEQRVRDGERLASDIERLGGDPAPARDALDTSACTLARALAGSARPLIAGSRDDADEELARQRLQRVVWAVDHLEQAESDWADAASSALGRLAITVGLAGPPDGC